MTTSGRGTNNAVSYRHQTNTSRVSGRLNIEIQQKLMRDVYPTTVDPQDHYYGARSSSNIHFQGVMVGQNKATAAKVFVEKGLKPESAPVNFDDYKALIDELKKKVVIAKKPPIFATKAQNPEMFNPKEKTKIRFKKVSKVKSRLS